MVIDILLKMYFILRNINVFVGLFFIKDMFEILRKMVIEDSCLL